MLSTWSRIPLPSKGCTGPWEMKMWSRRGHHALNHGSLMQLCRPAWQVLVLNCANPQPRQKGQPGLMTYANRRSSCCWMLLWEGKTLMCVMSDQITVTAKYKTQHIYWLLLRLRTKKGLQGGKTIQQRSEFFTSLVPNASTSSLAHALVRSLHTCMCVYYSVSTQLCVAATLLLLPGAGTHDSDRPHGLIVVTPW